MYYMYPLLLFGSVFIARQVMHTTFRFCHDSLNTEKKFKAETAAEY